MSFRPEAVINRLKIQEPYTPHFLQSFCNWHGIGSHSSFRSFRVFRALIGHVTVQLYPFTTDGNMYKSFQKKRLSLWMPDS